MNNLSTQFQLMLVYHIIEMCNSINHNVYKMCFYIIEENAGEVQG